MTVDDLEAEGLRAEVRRRLFGETEHALPQVGRYVLHEPLGRGGMGVVHAAYDPDLDRRVALKLVRPKTGASNEATARRLIREAQSIARLSHPNVVAVYEVGRTGAGVYIAMELIEGMTLRRWCEQHSPARGQLLRVLIDAGQGLAAAHERGLIHRDFKPDNVMVDLDDADRPTRVRVLDFGLARPHQGDDTEPSTELSDDGSDGPAFEAMTQTGTVLGTPAYMAPEQRRGAVGPRSDQFAYCMTLAEALLGRRPAVPSEGFDGVLPEGAKHLPRRLASALERGLRADPHARWPSMARLLTELEAIASATSKARGRMALGLGALVLGTAVTAAATDDAQTCEDGSSRSAALWPDERRQRVAAAFSQSGLPYAGQTWATVEHTLDQRLQQWADALDQHCEQRQQPQDQWWARASCLDRQGSELSALITLFEQGDPMVIEHAAEAADALPTVERCAAGPGVPAPDPQHAVAVEKLRVELASLSATAAAGQFQAALPSAEAVLEKAATLGYGPLIAEATLMVGRLRMGAGDATEAEQQLYAAVERAEADRHDEVTARAWLLLLEVVAVHQARIDDADRLLAPAKGAIRRLGEPGLLMAQAWTVEGALRHAQGRFDDAVQLHQRALALLEQTVGTHDPRLARALHGIAKAQQGQGEPVASLAPARRALELTQAHRGPEHPDVATYLSTLANGLVLDGQPYEALPHFQRSTDVLRRSLGPDHPRLAAALHNLGSLYANLRRFDEALPVLRQAMAIDTKTHGADHPHAAASHYAIAMVLQQQGDQDAAEAELRVGLDAVERAWGPDHPDLAYLVVALGHLLLERERPEDAIVQLERGDRLLRDALGERHPRRVHGIYGLARAQAMQGQLTPARKNLEEALDIAEAAAIPDLDRATVRFLLARVLPPDALGRARQLARLARDTYRDAGPTYDPKRTEIEQWLHANAKPTDVDG